MWPVAEVTQAGRGRCIVAARDIAAGETVLSERPALLFVQPEFEASVCACCLRSAQGVPLVHWHNSLVVLDTPLALNRARQPLVRKLSALQVSGTSSRGCTLLGTWLTCVLPRFCSALCAQEAAGEGGAHSPRMCRALQQLGSVGLSAEVLSPSCSFPARVETDPPSLFAQEQHLGRFVLNAYDVKAAARTSSAEAVRPYQECLEWAQVLTPPWRRRGFWASRSWPCLPLARQCFTIVLRRPSARWWRRHLLLQMGWLLMRSPPMTSPSCSPRRRVQRNTLLQRRTLYSLKVTAAPPTGCQRLLHNGLRRQRAAGSPGHRCLPESRPLQPWCASSRAW